MCIFYLVLDNDPWTSVSPGPGGASGKSPVQQKVSEGSNGATATADSLDMFSPQAQSQLQEFDLLRAEIEGGEPNNNNGNGECFTIPLSFSSRSKMMTSSGLRNLIKFHGFFSGMSSPNPFDLKDLDSGLLPPTQPGPGLAQTGAKPKKTVQSLLGEHSNLVNLDNLVSDSQPGEEANRLSRVAQVASLFPSLPSAESLRAAAAEPVPG